MCVAGRRPLSRWHEVAAAHGRARRSAADVSDPAGAQHAVQACLERFGRLDALVVSSGTGGGEERCSSRRSSASTAVLATNLTGTFLLCQAALPAADRESGRDRHRGLAGRSARRPRVGGLLLLQGRDDHAHAMHRPGLRSPGRARQLRLSGLDRDRRWPMRRWTSSPACTAIDRARRLRAGRRRRPGAPGRAGRGGGRRRSRGWPRRRRRMSTERS